jgi:hypothetical protein
VSLLHSCGAHGELFLAEHTFRRVSSVAFNFNEIERFFAATESRGSNTIRVLGLLLKVLNISVLGCLDAIHCPHIDLH